MIARLLTPLRPLLAWLQETLIGLSGKPSFGRTWSLPYVLGGALLAITSGFIRILAGEVPEFEMVYLATTGATLYASGKALSPKPHIDNDEEPKS